MPKMICLVAMVFAILSLNACNGSTSDELLESSIIPTPARPARTSNNPPGLISMDADMFHTCAIARGKVYCWGANQDGQTNVPEGLKNPMQVTTGYNFSCAITDDGVICWGGGRGVYSGPAMRNPTRIDASIWQTCATTDDGLVCWGQSVFDPIYNTPLPDEVSLGGYNGCVIAGNKVHCWGQFLEQSPEFKNPKQISVGPFGMCAISDEGLKCSREIPSYLPPEVLSARQVSVGTHATCAIVTSGVICWGSVGGYRRDR